MDSHGAVILMSPEEAMQILTLARQLGLEPQEQEEEVELPDDLWLGYL